jgi:L-arabinonolactonase
MVDIRICVPSKNMLGEGPIWDVEDQRLYWVDGLEGHLLSCSAYGADVEQWTLPAEIGSFALRKNGGAIVALETGLHLFDFRTGALDFIANPEAGKEHVRLNDGKVDSKGRFVVGSLDMTAFGGGGSRGRGVLYRVDADLSVHPLFDGIACTNGPCWSPDEKTFYCTDSFIDTIYAFDWDEARGVPSNRRVFAQCEPLHIPDGATVDSEGFYWVALNGALSGAAEVRRHAPDGRLDRTITMPTARLASLTFGGADLDILYVTTLIGNQPTPIPVMPLDGHLFSVHGLGVRGLASRRFAG